MLESHISVAHLRLPAKAIKFPMCCWLSTSIGCDSFSLCLRMFCGMVQPCSMAYGHKRTWISLQATLIQWGRVWEINASASCSQMGWLWGILHIVSPRVPRGLELMVHRSELLTDALLFWDFLLTFTHVLIFASWDHYLKSPSVPAFILRESKPKKQYLLLSTLS